MSGDVLEAQLAYWKRQLGGDLSALELPMDLPPTASQESGGGARSLLLKPVLVEPLRSLARREGCTSAMALLAAFQLLPRSLERSVGRHRWACRSPTGTPQSSRGSSDFS